jgi:D-xylose transport system substrate-binding protein
MTRVPLRVLAASAIAAVALAGCSSKSSTPAATGGSSTSGAAPTTAATSGGASTSAPATSAAATGAATGAASAPPSSSAASVAPVTASAKIAFLMPDQASTRYEQHDHPGFVTELKKVCPACTPLYNNADGDASKQQQQFDSALAQGAKVIVLDPVDSAAAATLVAGAQAKGVKVIAYDRPIPSAKVDYYVSFDNEAIGKSIAQSLVTDLKKGSIPSGAGILEVNGSPTDAAAGLIKKGIHEGLAGSGITTLAEFDTPQWLPTNAQNWVSGQISRFGKKIVGVVAANDGTGGGAIAAFKAKGVNPVPPVTGNDATIAGLQLIIAGDQYNTISKPSEIVAAAAADAAAGFLTGKSPVAKTTVFGSPSELFTPAVVTAATLKADIIDKNINKAADLCTANYAAACKKLGIS